MPQARLLLLGAGAAKSARIDTHMKEKETGEGKVWLEYPECREVKSGVLSVPQNHTQSRWLRKFAFYSTSLSGAAGRRTAYCHLLVPGARMLFSNQIGKQVFS